MILIMLICGILVLVRGETKITRNRRVTRTKGRALGVFMLLGGVVIPFIVYNDASQPIAIAAALLTFVIGFAMADKVEGTGDAPNHPGS